MKGSGCSFFWITFYSTSSYNVMYSTYFFYSLYCMSRKEKIKPGAEELLSYKGFCFTRLKKIPLLEHFTFFYSLWGIGRGLGTLKNKVGPVYWRRDMAHFLDFNIKTRKLLIPHIMMDVFDGCNRKIGKNWKRTQ